MGGGGRDGGLVYKYMIECFNASMFDFLLYICNFKSPSREGHWKLAVAINAVMQCIRKLFCLSLQHLSL